MERQERHLLDQSWRKSAEAGEVLGEVGRRFGGHPHVFPNMWIMPYGNQISVRFPRGPLQTEIWWFTFTYEQLGPDERYEIVRKAIRHNGPAGMFESGSTPPGRSG
jgi:3-phenylpropionate/trans-cinnamate dioxygenase alpha subunit